jgi:hypothetical protein
MVEEVVRSSEDTGHFYTHNSVPQLIGGMSRCCSAHPYCSSVKIIGVGHQWLTPVIFATQEAEIRRIVDQNQPQQTVCKNLS